MIDLNLVRTKLPRHVTHPDPELYRSGNYVALDFETTTHGKGLPIYDVNSIVLAAWRLGPDHPGRVGAPDTGVRNASGMRYKFAGEYGLGELVRDIERADFIIAHNAKFELGWLQRCGLDLSTVVVWDTMIAEYVLGGNRWMWKQLSLEACAKRHFGPHCGKVDIVSQMIKECGLCCTEIPASWLRDYCIQDVMLSERLYYSQLKAMEGTRLLPVVYTRCLATPVLADLEKNGMMLDAEKVLALREEKEREYAAVLRELEEVTGGINIENPTQLRTYLYETLKFDEVTNRRGEPIRTKTDLKKTDAATLEKLRARTAQQRKFLELYQQSKELYNELTKYLRKFGDCCDESGGHLRAQFNQTNTRTHRLSSSGLDYNAQFQNFPRQYKPLFRSRRPGWYMGEADGSQLEFRVAGHLGRDRVALRDIRDGADIHSVTAGVIWPSLTPSDPGVQHPKRQDAKPHTFKPLYGGRSGTPDEVRYYEFFREKYAGVAATQQRWVNSVLRDKYLETEWGLRYYWPDCRMERSGYIVHNTSICNYPVQAFATAEIIPIGFVYFWHYLQKTDLQMFLVNTVHDSIIAELPPEEIEDFDALSYRCMVEEVYGYLKEVYRIDFTVPLAAGVSHGINWGDKMAKKNERTYTAADNLVEDM